MRLCYQFLSNYTTRFPAIPLPQSSSCFKYVSENVHASRISKWGDPFADRLFVIMLDFVVFPMAEILF